MIKNSSYLDDLTNGFTETRIGHGINGFFYHPIVYNCVLYFIILKLTKLNQFDNRVASLVEISRSRGRRFIDGKYDAYLQQWMTILIAKLKQII